MLEIIHSPDVKKILRFHIKSGKRYSVIILNKEFQEYRDILKSKGIIELPVEDMDDKERKICEKKYINSIARLGFEYHSIQWWANPISEKNEHISSHYKNLYAFYILIKTIQKHIAENMSIFVICNSDIFEQLKTYCIQNNVQITSLERHVVTVIRKAQEKAYAAIKNIFFIIKTVIRRNYIPKGLRLRIKNDIANTRNYYVIRTWLDNRFLSEKDRDAYFGKLPEYVMKNGHSVLILAGIINNYSKVVHNIANNTKMLIVPEEYFFQYSDIFRLLFHILIRHIKLRRNVIFNGVDVTGLYKREILKGYYSTDYMRNISRYFIAKRFAESVNFKTYIQTFENYAWEKITILGIKKAKPDGKIFGFQHAFISRNSFKYFPGEKENEIMSLPDRIITMGKKTMEIMCKYGSYDAEIFRIGCALRQEYLNDFSLLKRKRFDKIVVPLTMVSNESVLVLKFLYKSGLGNTKMKVIIRCHPAAPYETFKKYIDFKMPDNFIICNQKSIQEELSDTDIVLYTWTTVAIEALKLGLPVIYIDILDPLNVDPLFECNALKKSVKKPEELLPVMEAFYSMNDDIFCKEQQTAQEYLKEYFYPVTEDNLASFMPDNK